MVFFMVSAACCLQQSSDTMGVGLMRSWYLGVNRALAYEVVAVIPVNKMSDYFRWRCGSWRPCSTRMISILLVVTR